MTSTLLGTPPPATAPHPIASILENGGVRSVYQPIVELTGGQVVAYEALARGPAGEWEHPMRLFDAAREAGMLAALDAACRAAAFRGAVTHGLVAPFTLFVNVEPEVLDAAPLDDLMAISQTAPGDLRVVLEITERALAARPAELLHTVERVRELGWGVAFDDVGADSASLAFMSLLEPDVVKLDLSLTQNCATRRVAELMHAVNAYAERSGALVLAEGIETEAHLVQAHALGATLGQGWLFGRPTATPDAPAPPSSTALPRFDQAAATLPTSPFTALPADTPVRRAPKRLLIELSKQLEREASRVGESCVVAATFQEATHFTESTSRRYRTLLDHTGFVCALGENMPSEPLPGVRGATLDPRDPVRGEWDVVVLGPQFNAALVARDLGDHGPDAERMFEYALTYRRDTVVTAARSLLSRVAPRLPRPAMSGDSVPPGLTPTHSRAQNAH